MTSSSIQGSTGINYFDRTSHLLLEGDDFAVCWVKLLPLERSARLAAIKLMPHLRSSDDSAVTVFSFSEDELVIEQTELPDKMVNALVGDDPYTLTPELLHVMSLRLSQFFGYINILWHNH